MEKNAWIISVNMGYGHQRTAFPLRDLAPDGKVINANDYPGIPEKDRIFWETTRKSYEFISKLKRFPVLGESIFFIFDQFQKIVSFYPKRGLSEPNFQLKQIFSLIKKGWGRDLFKKLIFHKGIGKALPLISTFFTPVFMAEYFNYSGEIFCIICDADISRTLAPLNPRKSKIKYFAPTERVVERLKLYGVTPENIFFTGYPLPLENVGCYPPTAQQGMEILKEDLRNRLLNLDPKKRFFQYYEPLIKKYLGELPAKSDHPLTIMFSVGGTGAQKEIGIQILKCLISGIKQGKVKVILSVGIREKIKEYFKKKIDKIGFKKNKNVEILFEKDIESYFQKFNLALRKTDILWTKPSELSFYSALGMPIIIAPAIGSQEEFNKRWLLKSGFGDSQGNPSNTDQWLFDWLEKGYFAEHAMQGFIEGEKLGTIKIKKIIEKCPG